MLKLIIAYFSLLLAANFWIYEIDSDVYMRQGPDNNEEILRTVSGGEIVRVLEKTNKWWWKVEYQGTEGYIASSFVVIAVPESTWKLIQAYPAIIGVLLFGLVFGLLRSWQRRKRKK